MSKLDELIKKRTIEVIKEGKYSHREIQTIASFIDAIGYNLHLLANLNLIKFGEFLSNLKQSDYEE